MKIKVIGIGGAGCNTIARLIKRPSKAVDFYALNTDAQALKACPCPNKILIGEKTTQGLGTGTDWRLGRKAAEESKEQLIEVLKGAEIVFLTAGLGGGTGSLGISVLGETAQSLGILTLSVATLPFSFEGDMRKRIAKLGLENLQKNTDAFLIVSNDRVLKIIGKATSVNQAFLRVDEVMIEALEGISDLLCSPGIISVDFADIEEVLRDSGRALLGIGRAKGEQRATAAVSRALQSPMLDFTPKKARGILFNVGGRDVSLAEVNLVANFIKRIADQKTKIIFGVSEDRNLEKGELKVTLIATGAE